MDVLVSTNVIRTFRNDGNDNYTDTGINFGANGDVAAWGDYDNDGDLDVALSCGRVVRNDGNGVFTDTGINLRGMYRGLVFWGDYDNDGDLDLAIIGYPASHIYRNDAGVFVDIGVSLQNIQYCSFAWGDYDNDGKLDFVLSGYDTSNSAYSTKVYHNDGNGSFTDINANLVGVSNGCVAWGDYDNDGNLDLAIAGYTNSSTQVTKIYHNDSLIKNIAPNAPTGLSTTIKDNRVIFSWNAATDVETPASGLSYNLRVGTSPGSDNIFSGMANSSSGLRKLPAIGNAQKRLSWPLKMPLTTFYWSVQAIDTGYLGSAWASEQSATIEANTISGVIRDPSGAGISGVEVSASNGGPTVTTDTTGHYELRFLPGWNGTVTPTKSNTALEPTSRSYSNLTTDQVNQDYAARVITDIGADIPGVDSNSIAWGDYDNDGDLDLAIAGMHYESGTKQDISKIYRNDGNGVFTDIGTNLVGVESASVAWGDYDNDGKLDLIISGYSLSDGKTRIYHNDGNDAFTDIGANLGSSGGAMAWGDYDNDGDLDLAFTNSGAYASVIYRNNGNGKFVDIGVRLAEVYDGCVTWADYDNDGDLDLAISGFWDYGNPDISITKIYRNDGNGRFTDIGADLPALGDSSVSWGDYDNDGDLDFVLTGYTGNPTCKHIIKICRNNGNDTFTSIDPGFTNMSCKSAAWGDYDNDGHLDLAVSAYDDVQKLQLTKIYRNDGTGHFVDSGVNLEGVSGWTVWGDYDGDGNLDLAETGTSGGIYKTFIFNNDSFARNTVPNAPTDLAASISANVATFNWNAGSDNQTPAGGLSYNLRVGTTPGACDVYSGMANSLTGLRTVPALGNAQEKLSFTLKNIPACKLYWSVQAIDTSYAGSPWATEQSVIVVPKKISGYIINASGVGIEGVTITATDCRYVVTTDSNGYYEMLVGSGWSGTVTPKKDGICLTPIDHSYSNVTSDKVDQNFVEAFTEINLSVPSRSYGKAAWGDYDNDGKLDLAIVLSPPYSPDYDPMATIYHNDGNRLFTDIGLRLLSRANPSWVDIDNDGNLDLGLSSSDKSTIQYMPKIYHNDGNSIFTDYNISYPFHWYSILDWGDYDNDGRPDFTASTDAYFTIYKYESNKKFSGITTTISHLAGSDMAWGDYDNDGDLDLAIAGMDAYGKITSTIYRNDGNDIFTDIAANLVGVYDCSIAWGDYDNDGDLDLAISGRTSSSSKTAATKIYRNDSNGVFSDIGTNIIGVTTSSLAWGDYDNDGDLDLAISGFAYLNPDINIARIYRNCGNGVFSDTGAKLSAISGASVSWGDFDDDGNLDLLVSGSGATKIYCNNSLIKNNPPTTPSNLTATVSVNKVTFKWDAAADIESSSSGLTYNLRIGTSPGGNDVFSGLANADGKRKIPSLGNAQKSLSWSLMVPAKNLYWSVQAIDNSYAGSAWADEQTVAITSWKICGYVRTPSGEGVGGVTLKASNYGPSTITDSDGYYELYVCDGWSGTVTPQTAETLYAPDVRTYSNITSNLHDQNYTRTLSEASTNFTATIYPSISWGDYDNDDDLDLAIMGDGIYNNDGNGCLTRVRFLNNGGDKRTIAWEDIDMDGNLDCSVIGPDVYGRSSCDILHNDGNSVFSSKPFNVAGVDNGYQAWGDYDNDGDLDIAVGGFSLTYEYICRIYRNDGNGIFTDISANLPQVTGCSMAWGDYDNDGDLDLAVAGYNGGYISKIYRNDGNGLFTDTNINLVGVSYCSLAWGDYNNDGYLDLAIAGQSSNGRISKIYRNCGNGEFSDIGADLLGLSNCSIAWGDYDNDGDLDLAVAGLTGYYQDCISKIYINEGDGRFVDSGANLPGVSICSVAWGDYNNDSKLDLVLSGRNGSSYLTKLYKNETLVYNTPPTAPTGLSANINGNSAVFKWNTATDDHTPSLGLSYNLRVGTSPGSDNIFSSMSNLSNGYRKIPCIGNAQNNLKWTLKNLPAGPIYWSVQAIDSSYAASSWANGTACYVTTKNAKCLQDGESICIRGVITAVFADCIYIEAEDRAFGIRAERTSDAHVGDKVYLTGTINTNSDGERYIAEATVIPIDSGSINPVNLTNRNLGGGDLNFSVGAGQCGVSGGFGLNNIGMLVKTTGKVMLVGDGYFYIDDGSNVQDSVSKGVRVSCEGEISILEKDHYVTVTGISSIMKTDSGYYRNLRATDIKLIK